MEQLTSQVNEIMLRRLKSEVLDLPEKVYVDDYVDMLPKQGIIYKEVEAGIKASIDLGEVDLTNPLATLIRLRQATGYTGILSEEIKESAKLDRMEELVENAVSCGDKVIIFSNWSQMTDAIDIRLRKNYKGVCITGSTPDVERQVNVNIFQNSDNCNYIVGTIGAMGTGLTLTAATTVIFVDEPWNKALFDQAVDRAHRIGQKNNITIYSIMCKDTIDERIHELIYKKGVMSDAIIDGKVLGNKTEIFNYLLS
jgi:SNF2 family DNA or RNA helicase